MIRNNVSRETYLHWLLLALFVAYQYLLRCCPSAFTNEIRSTFSIDANQFANFGVVCMLAYSVLQIPFGIAMDRIGIRSMVLFSFAVCLIGQYLFTNASSYEMALWGRILTGVGGAPAYMSALKLVADTFPQKLRGIFIGITGMFTLSTVVGNPWLKKICLEQHDWRVAANHLTYLGAIIFFLCCWFLFPKKSSPSPHSCSPRFRETVASVVMNGKVYLYAFFIIGTNIVAMTLAELWGPSFLMTKYRLGEQAAVNVTQLISIGMVLGELFLPIFFVTYTKMIIGVRLCCAGLIILFSILIDGSHWLDLPFLQVMLFLIGWFGAADVLAFTLGAHLSTPQTSGFLISWINCIGMLGEPCLQKWVGFSLDHHWSGSMNPQGLRMYQTADYEFALRFLVIVMILCFLCSYAKGRKRPDDSR